MYICPGIQNDPNTYWVFLPVVGLVGPPSLIVTQMSSYHIRIIFVSISYQIRGKFVLKLLLDTNWNTIGLLKAIHERQNNC